jgi:hypothetical protein
MLIIVLQELGVGTGEIQNFGEKILQVNDV